MDWQVCTPLPVLAHCAWPGAHTPVHAPLTHVWFEQATAVPQAPPEHVWTPLPEHVVWPGAQAPEHPPLLHVWLVQAAAALQVPLG